MVGALARCPRQPGNGGEGHHGGCHHGYGEPGQPPPPTPPPRLHEQGMRRISARRNGAVVRGDQRAHATPCPACNMELLWLVPCWMSTSTGPARHRCTI